MMKRLILVFAALIAAASAFGQDAGLDLSATAGYASTDTAEFSWSVKAAPWFKLPLGQSSEFKGSGYVQFSSPSDFAYDIDSFAWTLILQNPTPAMKAFTFELGRVKVADSTGYIFSNAADGVNFIFDYPLVSWGFSAATTGLLFNVVSPIAMSKTDQARAADSEFFGSPRFVSSVSMTFPRVFGQSLGLAAFIQEDLNPAESLIPEGETEFQPGKGGPFDTEYISLKASGPIASLLYDFFATYGTGRTMSYLADAASDTGFSYQLAPISSILTGLSVFAPLPALLPGAALGFRALFASGDKEAVDAVEGNTHETYLAFTPVTPSSLGIVFSPSLSNLVFLEASLQASPNWLPGRLSGAAKLMAFMRPTAGPISTPGVAAGSTSPWLGTELDIVASYGIYSDLGVLLIVGAFLPGVDPAGAFSPDYAGSHFQYSAQLTVSLAL